MLVGNVDEGKCCYVVWVEGSLDMIEVVRSVVLWLENIIDGGV